MRVSEKHADEGAPPLTPLAENNRLGSWVLLIFLPNSELARLDVRLFPGINIYIYIYIYILIIIINNNNKAATGLSSTL